MEILFVGILLILLALALPYFYKIYGLKKISQADIPSEGNWVKLSRGNIYYRWFMPEYSTDIKGSLVLVHGFSTPSFVWQGLLDNFTNSGFKVLVYDHFGRGYSERPRTQYDKNLYLETLRELILSQKINEKVHIVGYSMGGPIASYYAAEYPNEVKSVSLIAPAGFSKSLPKTKS